MEDLSCHWAVNDFCPVVMMAVGSRLVDFEIEVGRILTKRDFQR